MDWETFFMNAVIGTIAGALIGLIGSVILNIIADLRGYKKIANKIGDTNRATLSHQHEDMEEHLGIQHKNMEEHLSGQISRNTELQKTTIDGVSAIKDSILAQKINEENRYNNLSEKQKDIKSQIDAIAALQKDWERLNTKCNEQEKLIAELKGEINILREQDDSLGYNKNIFHGRSR